MKILVTGGAGFIGSHIVEAFVAAGHQVEVVDSLSTGKRANLPSDIPIHVVDIRDPALDAVFAAFKPEVVAHLAAQASVKISTGDPITDLSINGGGTANVVEHAVRHGVRKLLYTSTGGMLYGEPHILPTPEDHPTIPTSNYGLSKRVGEQYVELAGRMRGLDYTILRYANVYGPRQDPAGEAGVIAIFTALMLAGQPCTIDGDGEQKKDYIYVEDVARANLLALDAGSGRAINIGTGAGTSVNTIFATLKDAVGYTLEPNFGPPRPGDVRNVWLDTSRARAELGWQATVDFTDGIARTIASFR
ncbi:MAG: NAD-dependent epimerase/dehydratase family protein [Tepidiformaceae bacterium]